MTEEVYPRSLTPVAGVARAARAVPMAAARVVPTVVAAVASKAEVLTAVVGVARVAREGWQGSPACTRLRRNLDRRRTRPHTRRATGVLLLPLAGCRTLRSRRTHLPSGRETLATKLVVMAMAKEEETTLEEPAG